MRLHDRERSIVTLVMFLCSMSVMTAYTLRKSERFCLAMYSCLSSCSLNANYDKCVSHGSARTKDTNGIVLQMRIFNDFRADLGPVQMALPHTISHIITALLRTVQFVQDLCVTSSKLLGGQKS